MAEAPPAAAKAQRAEGGGVGAEESPLKTEIIPTEEVLRFVEGLRFTQPVAVLEEPGVKDRAPCPKCGKRRQYFCYDCVNVTVDRARPRDVRLPVKVHVLLHKGEHKGKATSVHAGVLSSDVSLYVHPDLPQGTRPEETLLVYPSPDAKTLDQMAADGELEQVKNLVFIDSTWKQSRAICRDDNVRRLGRPVQLNEYRTLFWRYQTTEDERFLATVEAIYYLLRDLHIAKGNPYSGEYDDLLYYYVHQYAVIQERYRTEEREFTKRHQKADAYIRKGTDFSFLLGQKRKADADADAAPAPPAPPASEAK